MKKLTGGIVLALMAMLFAGMFTLPPAYAQTTVDMTPSTNPDVGLGYSWNVTVWVSNVISMFGYQVNMIIDDNLLNITGAWNPTGDPQWVFYGQMQMPLGPTFYDNNGNGVYERVLIGSTELSGATPFTGTGKLAIIEFTILKAPQKYETLTCPLNINNTDTKLLDSSLAEISAVKVDGTYTWAWAPPPYNPYLSAETPKTLFEYYTIWNGTYFDVTVYIRQLHVNWVLHNASFKLSYNGTLTTTEAANVSIAPEWTTWTVAVTPGDPGEIAIFVSDYVTPPPSGDILVATITFKIVGQGSVPPRPSGAADVSLLQFYDVILMDTFGAIPTEPHQDLTVTVQCFQALPPPYMEVVPNDSIWGPDLILGDQYGKTFKIEVHIKNLVPEWFLVGVQFRLSFDPSLVEVVSVEEGGFLAQFNNTPTPPYTFFISYIEIGDPIYGTHILVGDLLLPNENGTWTVFPEGEGPIAVITLRPLVQSWTETYTGEFNFIEVVFADKDAKPIGVGTNINGTLTILPIDAVGRRIDVWMQYPAPYGGQGLMEPADLVVPQQMVYLTAKVTYNWWPVAQKLVTFHVYDNNGNLFTNLQGMTDDFGHVTVWFRMPSENVDAFTGVWTVNATVEVAEQVIFDIMQFHFDWLVRTWKITTDKTEYMHLETIQITVEFGSHAQQEYVITLKTVLFDNLTYTRGLAYVDLTIGGATFCTYKNYSTTLTITIPWYAAAGQATIKVQFLQGGAYSGTAVTPEAEKKIWILPL